jgi:signal transduction histidine kinase
MKLITRYNRLNLPVMLFVFFVSSAVGYFLIRRVLQNELDNGISRVRKRIETYVNRQHALPVTNAFYNEIVEFERIATPLSDTGFKTTRLFIPRINKYHVSRKLIFSFEVNNELYKATVTSTLEGTSHVTVILLIIMAITVFLIILVSVIINRLMLSKLWLPFYESLRLLGKFKIDRSEPFSFPKTRTDEFNFMIDNLKTATSSGSETYQHLKEFTENASHEIQTPLAIIRSKLDVFIQLEDLSESQSETARSMFGAIDKLSRLSQSFLLITKIGNHQFENRITVDLCLMIRGKLSQFRELWQTNNIEITSKLQDSEIQTNEELMDILLNNLLSNATKHNLPNGEINIEMQSRKLSISNTGQSSSLDHKRIFKRFYKEMPRSEGNGLGLSIIGQICDASGITASYQFSGNRHAFILSW